MCSLKRYTAFSLIYRKPFAVLPNHEGKPPLRSANLLRQLHEESHIVADAGNGDAIEAALKAPPRESTAEAIARLRAVTIRRLKSILPDVSKAPAIVPEKRYGALSWPFRKAWGGVKCIGENGVSYTVKHAFGKALRFAGVRSRL